MARRDPHCNSMKTDAKLDPHDRQKLLKLLKFGPRLPRKNLARYAVEMAKKAA